MSVPSHAATNLLYELDKAAQGVVDRVSQAQEAAMGAAPGAITFGNEMPTLLMHRQVCVGDIAAGFVCMVVTALPLLLGVCCGSQSNANYIADALARATSPQALLHADGHQQFIQQGGKCSNSAADVH